MRIEKMSFTDDNYHPWWGGMLGSIRLPPDSADMSRIDTVAGMPLLVGHDDRQHVGRVERAWVETAPDRTVFYASADIPETVPGNANTIAKLTSDPPILTGVSVSYNIDWNRLVQDNRGAVTDIEDALWTAHGGRLVEISLTPTPVVATVGLEELKVSQTEQAADVQLSVNAAGEVAAQSPPRVMQLAQDAFQAQPPSPPPTPVSSVGFEDMVNIAIQQRKAQADQVALSQQVVTLEEANRRLEQALEQERTATADKLLELEAKLSSVQIQPERVATFETLDRRPLSLHRYAALQVWQNERGKGHFPADIGGRAKDFTIEESLLERLGDTRRDTLQSVASIPFALMNEQAHERRLARARARGERVEQTVLVAGIDDDSDLMVTYPGEGQLALDLVFPLLSRFDLRYGLTEGHRVTWFSSHPSPNSVTDGGTISDEDFAFEGKTLSPKTVYTSTALSFAMRAFDDGSIERLIANSQYRLMNEAIVKQVVQGGGSNEMTGIASQSDITTRDIGAATDWDVFEARKQLAYFWTLKGSGGVGMRRDTIVIGSSAHFIDAFESGQSDGVDRWLWDGGPQGRWVGLVDAFLQTHFDIADTGTGTVVTHELPILIVNADAVVVGFFGQGLDFQMIPSPTAATTQYRLTAAVDCTVIDAPLNSLIVEATV